MEKQNQKLTDAIFPKVLDRLHSNFQLLQRVFIGWLDVFSSFHSTQLEEIYTSFNYGMRPFVVVGIDPPFLTCCSKNSFLEPPTHALNGIFALVHPLTQLVTQGTLCNLAEVQILKVDFKVICFFFFKMFLL